MEIINIKFKQKNKKKFKLCLSYQLYSEYENTIQESYHICFYNEQKLIWDSGIVLTNTTINIECNTDKLKNHHEYQYVITVNTNNGIIQNEGILSIDYIFPKWKADWIECDSNDAYEKSFKVNSPVNDGYLYISSNQIINPVINGLDLNKFNNDLIVEDGIHTYEISCFLQNGLNNLQIFYKKINNQLFGLKYEIHLILKSGKIKIIKSENEGNKTFIPITYKYCIQKTIDRFNVIFKNKLKIFDCGRIVFGRPVYKDYFKKTSSIVICSETIDFYRSIKFDLSNNNYLKFSKFRYFIIAEESSSETRVYIEDYGLELKPIYKVTTSNFYINEIMNYILNYLNIYYSELCYTDSDFSINELAFITNYLLLHNFSNGFVVDMLNNYDLKHCLNIEAKTPLTGLFDIIEIVWNVYKKTNDKLLLKKYYSTFKALINKITMENFTYPEIEISIYYYYVDIIVEIAEILCDDKNVIVYKNKMKKISKNYCKFYSSNEGYLKNENVVSYSCSIVSGIANVVNGYITEMSFKKLIEIVINKNYNKEEVVIYLPIIIEALMIARRGDLGIDLISEYYDEIRNSINPVTSLLFINFLKRCIMGIYDSYCGNDNRSIIIKPQFIKSIDRLNVTCHYAEGNLLYNFLYNNKLSISVDTPANLNCAVVMPNGKICSFKSGRKVFEKNN